MCFIVHQVPLFFSAEAGENKAEDMAFSFCHYGA